MEQNKQTALDYFLEQLGRIGFSTFDDFEYQNEIMIAKQMEKEQIADAYNIGKVEANFPPEMLTNGEQYYNETYGKE